MKTLRNSLPSLAAKLLALAYLALALGISDARAGLIFQLYLYTVNHSYVFYTPLFTNVTPPAAPLGTYFVYSPQQPTNGSWRQLELTTSGMATIAGSEGNFGDYDSVMQQITNGFWHIVVTNATSTNTYRFTVSAPNMSSNLLPLTTITFPSDGATEVTNWPNFTWQGPSSWSVDSFAEIYQFDPSYNFTFYQNASIPAGQTNWTIPVPIPAGTNTTFSVRTTTNYTKELFVATTPLNTNNSQPIAGWASTSTLESGASANFMTALPPPSLGGHRLVAHYPFDDSGNLGADSSGTSNDMNTGSWWGPGPAQVFSTDAEAGGGAVEFFGTSSMTPSGSVLSNWDATLGGSFTISTWVKTTSSIGNDGDDAIFGATIFWAYNDHSGTNDTIPLAITGSKAAFTTRDHLGNSTTLHSITSVNDGNYHLITVTRDSTTGEKKIFVDGNWEASEIGTTDPLNGNDYYLSIGGTTSSSYAGLLDDVQMYAGVLSASEITSLHSNPGSTAPNVSGAGLQAHYDFDEATVVAPDVSGNGNPIIHAGNFGGSGPAISMDTIAGAGSVSFDGYSYLTASSNLLSTIAADFSISLWVKTSQSVGSPGDMAYWGAVIVSADIVTGGAGDAVPIALTAGQVAFNTGDGSADETLNSTATVNDDAWYHLVVTRNQSTGEKQIYIDGALDSSEIGTTVLLDGPKLLTIGAKSDASYPDPASPDSNGSHGYEGLLDDIQIYSRVLSSNEVVYLHSNPGATIGSTTAPPYPVDLALQTTFVRAWEFNRGEYYYASVSFDSVLPAPSTTNIVRSPNGCIVAETYPSGGSSSSQIYSTLGDVLNECTNGSWQILINQGSSTQQVYSFKVSVSGLDTNVLTPVIVYLPTNGAVNIDTNPAFHWVGPSNYSTLLVDLLSGPVASLPVTATNWPSALTLSYGPDRFDVAYTSNGFPGVSFTTPVDASANTVRTWATTVNLSTAVFNNFVVGAPAPLPVLLTNVTGTGSNLQFSIMTLAGRPHTIQASTNLVAGTWLDLTNFIGDGMLQQFIFAKTNIPTRFFRMQTR